MQDLGGLKLRVKAASPGDRRTRFAQLELSDGDGGNQRVLVTDASGRMRFHLPDGDYRLRISDGLETRFAVRDQRWTTVHLRLT